MGSASSSTAGAGRQSNETELRLEGVEKRFDGERAVDGVTFSITAGEHVAIVGPSGAGKTTLLRLMSGAISPDSGNVLVDGDQVGADDVSLAYHGETLVGRRSALANVLVGRTAALSWWRGLLEPLIPRQPRPALEALKAVGLGEKARTRADRLSAGERQRVAFARALVQRSAVVLADEPTANLDPATRETVLDVLEEAVGERPLGTVLHDVELALERYDRIVGLEAGAIRFDRPADEVDDSLLADLFETTDSNDRGADSATTETGTRGDGTEPNAVPRWYA